MRVDEGRFSVNRNPPLGLSLPNINFLFTEPKSFRTISPILIFGGSVLDLTIWKHKDLGQSKTIQSNENTDRSVTIPDFTLYHRDIVINIEWQHRKARDVDQWDKTKDPDVSIYNDSGLSFGKDAKMCVEEKTEFFLTDDLGKRGIYM